MKKILLTLSLVLFTIIGYSQASNTDEFRIADATTTFDQNLPVGTKVYNIGTGDYWVANTGVLGTATLTTASGSFDCLNCGTAAQNLSLGATTATTQVVALSGGTDATLVEANTNDAGLLGADKWDEIVANTAKVTNVTTNLTEGTTTNTTVDVNSSDGTNATLLAASTSRAGVMTKALFDKLTAIAAGAEVNLTSITETFEEDDATPTAHTLGQTAVTAQGARVSFNGATLDPANYTLATGSITIANITVSQYDQVTITYFY